MKTRSVFSVRLQTATLMLLTALSVMGQSLPETKPVFGGISLPSFVSAAAAQTIGNREQMELYVTNNPTATDASWVRNKLASIYRHTGRITPALAHWSAVWQQLKDSTDDISHNEANHALAGQLELLTTLGRVESLYNLLKTASARTITDPEDRRRIEESKEGYETMLVNPSLNYRCGTLALAEIARKQGKSAEVINALVDEPSPKEGISLLRLVQLSRQYDLGMVAVKRTDSTPLPVPCVVHWAQNHYGALMEFHPEIGSYRVNFGDPNWMTAPDVNAEASGFFLISADQRPATWPIVSDAECAKVLGRSFIYKIDDSKDKGCKVDPTNPKAGCPHCTGMPTWWVTEPYINLFLADEPVSYTTSRGENFPFRATIKQRDTTVNQATSPQFAYPRPGFLHNWYGRIFVQGMPVITPQYVTNYVYGIYVGITTNWLPVLDTNGFASWTATADLGTGGQVTYFSNTNSASSYDEETRTTLMPTYGVVPDGTQYPIPGYPIGGTGVGPDWTSTINAGVSIETNYPFWNDASSGFIIFQSDGSFDRYGLTYWRSNGFTGYYESEALLTQHTDPVEGNISYFYEQYLNPNSTYCFRLKYVVDYDGNTNTLAYFSATSPYIKQITTPYSQTASFAFDGSGNLTNITDAVSNSSGLVWDTNGRVKTLNTPYGATSFHYFDRDVPSTNFDGDSVPANRAVTVTDPGSGVNIYAYCFNMNGYMASQFSTNAIPQSTPLGTLDVGTNVVDHGYGAVSFRNSFHWSPRQTAVLSTLSVSNFTANDFLKGRMQHWLGDSNNVYQTGLLSVEQEPSPDGTAPGQLTFYDYYGKNKSFLQGTNSLVAVVARRQPSGLTEYDWKQYNSDGFVTKDISTYATSGGQIATRTNTFIYATNTISLILTNAVDPGYSYGIVFFLNDGYMSSSGGPAMPPTYPYYPVIALYQNVNSCGAWSGLSSGGVAAVSPANLLIASIDAYGATNFYGSYKTVSTVVPGHLYTAWQGEYVWNKYNWRQQTIYSRTIPLPTRTTNAAGYITSYAYDSTNHLVGITSPAGLTTTNLYNTNGFLATTIDLQTGRTNSFTYLNGKVRTWTNERGLVTTTTWDNLQRLVTKSDTEGYVSNVYTRLDLVASKDKMGGWTYYGYDALENPVAKTNANNEITLSLYCSCGALEWKRDAITNYTYYNYDLVGRLSSVNYPDGYSVTNYYNSLNQLTGVSDALGYTTNYYNLQGLIALSANGKGILQSNSYDVLDRKIAVTDKRGIITTFAFDSLNRVTNTITAGTLTDTFVYSTNGLVKTVDGLRTNSTFYINDVMGRVIASTNANNEVVQYGYDSSGNVTNIVDGNQHNTWFKFDSFSRMTNKLDNSQASALQLTYDANSQIKTRWTPEKGQTTYIRDPMGRVRTNSYQVSPQVIFMYDSNGNLTTMVDTAGTNMLTYSPAGQLLTEGGLWANDTVSRTYQNQLRNTLTVGSQGTAYLYDSAHRLYNITAPSGSYTYTYHPGYGGAYSSSLIQSLSLPNSISVTNGYDFAARLTATVMLTNMVPVDSQQYGYDSDNRRTTLTRFDGSTATYTYDSIGQVKTATAKEPSVGTPRLNEQFGYSYDKAGNLYTRTNNTLALTFTVSAVNTLSNVTRSGTLTASGNTAQPAISVSVNSQSAALYGDKTFATSAGLTLTNGSNTFSTMVQYSGKSQTTVAALQLPTPVVYLNDANGNLTNDGLRSFRYDDENQLTSIVIPNQTRTDFVYDGLNRRRITRSYAWSTNSSWNLSSEVHFIYDGNVVIQERDTNNNVLANYDRGLDLSGSLQGAGGIGGLLARTDIKGSVYYHNDGQGNVVMLLDKYRTQEAKYLYDPYGNLLGKWGPYADVNMYRYSSKEWDPVNSVYYFCHRFYDPNLQRWLNRDPSSESGGLNLYTFVANGPVNLYDSLGLCGEWSWNAFGNWELDKLTAAKEFFTGKPDDFKPDPNSLLYLSNQAGVGNTALTDKDGNIVSGTDLAFDVLTQPLIALVSGGLGEIADLAFGGRMMAAGSDVADVGLATSGKLASSFSEGANIVARSAGSIGENAVSLKQLTISLGKAGMSISDYEVAHVPEILDAYGNQAYGAMLRTLDGSVILGNSGKPLIQISDLGLSSMENAVKTVFHEIHHVDSALGSGTVSAEAHAESYAEQMYLKFLRGR